MSNIDYETGQKIKELRKMRKLTHAQLAQKIGKTQSTISKYESGEISIDLNTLYRIAEVLQVYVEQLLSLPEPPASPAPRAGCPAFFQGQQKFYSYAYDGRVNQISRRVLDLFPGQESLTKVMMYMNFRDYDHYQNCENTYKGYMQHFDTITNITLHNRDVVMETVFIQILTPSMNTDTKWALFTGLSTRPIMPCSRKILISKKRLPENEELEQSLKISREDIRRLKHYQMLTVT